MCMCMMWINNGFIAGNISLRSLSVPFAKIAKSLLLTNWRNLIFTTNWQAIALSINRLCVQTLPSAIKWRIIKKVIPLITAMRISLRSHFVAPISYWNIAKSIRVELSWGRAKWCSSSCFRPFGARWILSDSFIQYPQRLNVHLISCFSSSFTKISYNDRYETFFSVVSFCFLINLTARNHVVHGQQRRQMSWRHQRRIWNEVGNYSKQSRVLCINISSPKVLPDLSLLLSRIILRTLLKRSRELRNERMSKLISQQTQ